MKQIWLIFAQAVTIVAAALFAVSVFQPQWLGRGGAAAVVRVAQEAVNPAGTGAGAGNTLSYATAAQRALPAVVSIVVALSPEAVRERTPNPLLEDPFLRRFFEGEGDVLLPEDDSEADSGFGSGVMVSEDGYVLTNNHVIENGEGIEVGFSDGRTFPARLVGSDPESDLAVLKINSNEALPAITFAGNESLRIGDVVLAIGNPFGVGQTVTMGIVSALGRSELGLSTFENYIQTDAAINPGNSGGALVDGSGNLVGINTAIFSRSGGSLGIGFAIPVSLVRHVMEEIIAHGTVTRGWIGVEIQELTPELAESFRVQDSGAKTLIAGVLTEGPAYKAGVEPGDILLAIDDQPIASPKDMQTRVAAIRPGDSAKFVFLRDGRELTKNIEIARRPLPKDMRR